MREDTKWRFYENREKFVSAELSTIPRRAESPRGGRRVALEYSSRQTCLILVHIVPLETTSRATRPALGSYEHIARAKTSIRLVNLFISCLATRYRD